MKEWYKNWFSSDEYLNLYTHRDDEDAEILLDLILAETKPIKNAVILDAACGAGRHCTNLASRGYNVVGFDLSKSLLRIAKQDAHKRNVSVNLFCGDFRKISLNKKFDLVLNLFTSFGYFLSDEENFSFVRTAYNMINEKCFYVLDFFNANYLSNHLNAETVKELGSKKFIERRKIEGNRVVKQITIQNDLIQSSYLESVQLYSKEKIVSEFEQIGFNLFKTFGDYCGSTFDIEKSQRLILFFQK